MIDDIKQVRLGTESALAMAERTIRRFFILLLVLIVMWGLTTGAFIWYLNQYDFESYEYQQDGEGVNIMGDWNGVSYYGSENNSQETD